MLNCINGSIKNLFLNSLENVKIKKSGIIETSINFSKNLVFQKIVRYKINIKNSKIDVLSPDKRINIRPIVIKITKTDLIYLLFLFKTKIVDPISIGNNLTVYEPKTNSSLKNDETLLGYKLSYPKIFLLKKNSNRLSINKIINKEPVIIDRHLKKKNWFFYY